MEQNKEKSRSEMLDSLLLSRFRAVRIDNASQSLKMDRFLQAMTVNENLSTIGYTLTAEDAIRLAESNSLYTLYDTVCSIMPEVEAKPLYPDFPSQVMEIDEAEYRFIQLLHYFSTYGIETLTGEEVLEGWVPDFEETPKMKKDPRLLSLKVLHLVNEKEVRTLLMNQVLLKRERMTDPDIQLAKIAVLDFNMSAGLPFKENIYWIAESEFNSEPMKRAYPILKNLSSNSGDILKFLRMYLRIHRYQKLRTSRKRCIVRLLEGFSVCDFSENLCLSRKILEENLNILNWVSFRRFSKDSAHMKVLDAARDGKLKSWHSKMEKMILEKDSSVLQFIGKRPGVLLRMISRLESMDFLNDNDILDEALKHSRDYSAQTLLTEMRKFSPDIIDNGVTDENVSDLSLVHKGLEDLLASQHSQKGDIFDPRRAFYIYNRSSKDGIISETCRQNREKTYRVFKEVLKKKLSESETPLKGKKIYINEDDYDISRSYIMPDSKSEEGGYLQSGVAVRIPEGVDRIRLFVYWNDERRVDIDLHAYAYDEGFRRERHIGWDADFRSAGIVSSGDLTNSNSTEFIDIDIPRATGEGVRYVYALIDSFLDRKFSSIRTVTCGAMATTNSSAKKSDIELYNAKNCFFCHELDSNEIGLSYCLVDLKEAIIYFIGKGIRDLDTWDGYSSLPFLYDKEFTTSEYLEMLLKSRDCILVEDSDDADIVLRMDKPQSNNELSLIDENYFLQWI